MCSHIFDNLEAIDRTHVDVCDYHIKGLFQKELESFFGVGQPLAGETPFGIVADEPINEKLVIIDDEELFQSVPQQTLFVSRSETSHIALT